MKFLIISNDHETCSKLTEIIESNNLGEVIKNDYSLNNFKFDYKKANVLIIDFLTATNYYLKTLHCLINSFNGKVIIVSKINDKGIIAKIYSLGVEYYIVKPINLLETVEILKKVTRLVELKNSILNIKNFFDLRT